MKNFLMIATTLLAGTAVAQTAPVAQPTPSVPPATAAPMAQPMRDKVTTRNEAVQMVREHFGAMDSNKDGSLTTAEIDAVHSERMKDFEKYKHRGNAMAMGDPNAAFDRLDVNKDQYISRDEFTKAREQRVERREIKRAERKGSPKDGKEVRRHVMRMHGPGGFGGRMIVMADTNKDGQITQSEAEALALQHFDQMDSNKDGQVTPEERRAARPMMFKRQFEEKKSGS